jgi:hypothetical protein
MPTLEPRFAKSKPGKTKIHKGKPKHNGKPFIPIYPGLWDYVERGQISYFQLGLYITIHRQCDWSTGVWMGSATKLRSLSPGEGSLRSFQRALQHMVEIGLLKHFHTRGTRGNFPWLLNKFICRTGVHEGKQLCAEESISSKAIIYKPVALVTRSCRTGVAESDALVSHLQEVQEVRSKNNNNEEQSESAAQTAAAPSPPPPAICWSDRFKTIPGMPFFDEHKYYDHMATIPEPLNTEIRCFISAVAKGCDDDGRSLPWLVAQLPKAKRQFVKLISDQVLLEWTDYKRICEFFEECVGYARWLRAREKNFDPRHLDVDAFLEYAAADSDCSKFWVEDYGDKKVGILLLESGGHKMWVPGEYDPVYIQLADEEPEKNESVSDSEDVPKGEDTMNSMRYSIEITIDPAGRFIDPYVRDLAVYKTFAEAEAALVGSGPDWRFIDESGAKLAARIITFEDDEWAGAGNEKLLERMRKENATWAAHPEIYLVED